VVNVVVVGAGIVGASVAYHLARRGALVTLLEADRPAAGTTSRSFAWANANEKPPRPYHDLNAAGLAEHHALRRELGPGGFHPTGNLEIAVFAEHRDALRQRVARLRDWGYAAELLSPGAARGLVPDVSIPLDAEVASFPDEGWVAGPVLVGQLLAAATKLGARVIYPAPVEALRVEGARVTGVATPRERLIADLVVDCAGPAAGRLLEPLGRDIARQRAPGVLAVSETLPTVLDRAVHAASVYVRPDGGGRVLIGSLDADAMLPASFRPGDGLPLDSEPIRELHRRGGGLVPLLEGARVETARVGWRPMPADGYSAVGPVSGVDGYYLVFTHSGITLGPVLGKLVAEELVTGRPRPELAAFRPDRLVRPVATTER
jgi:glycine/D-amino acid oxidase-like deaminating enzyme